MNGCQRRASHVIRYTNLRRNFFPSIKMKNKQKQGSLEHQMQKRLIPHIQAFHESNPDANFDVEKLIPFLYTKDMSLRRKTQQNLNRIVEGGELK